MAYTVDIGRRRFHGLRGNLHMHTVHSDGTKTHRELGQIAEQAGLDYLVVTDHNVLVRDGEGRYGKTLVLVGEEVHDTERAPQSSHTLCFDIDQDVAGYGGDPQRLIDAVAAQGGFTFLAHPFERDAVPFLPEPNISWRDWQVAGYAGIELWNYMSEFKGALKSKPHAVLSAYFPALTASGPYPETLSKWDELLRTRPIAALGGSDAHSNTYRLGPLSRQVQSYAYLFRCVNTHLLIDQPLTSDRRHDRAAIYGSLRAGRGFLGYERPGPIAGFAFWATSGDAEATMGETLAMQGTVELQVTCPRPAEIRLLRDGQVVAKAQGERLTLVAREGGVYRIEAYRRYIGRRRGWIFSNPIYVR
jgi:hypothetical protein